jgi:hypothetical protein
MKELTNRHPPNADFCFLLSAFCFAPKRGYSRSLAVNRGQSRLLKPKKMSGAAHLS